MSLEVYLKDLVRQAVREELATQRPVAVAPPPRTVPEYLSVADAAALVSVSTGTVRGWLKSGTLRTYRVGRVVRVKRAELEALLARGEVSEAELTPEQEADTIFRRLDGRAASTQR